MDNSTLMAKPPNTESGVARLKAEFILSEYGRKPPAEDVTVIDAEKTDPQTDELDSNGSDGPTSCKKARISKQEKKKLRGQNKARPPPFKFEREKNLCHSLVNIGEADVLPRCGNEKCTFIHDISKYLSIKPPDIGPVCYIYSLRGHCERGITCRYGSQHITSAGRNMTDETLYNAYKSKGLATINFLPKDLQHDLRKWRYNFSTSQNVIDKLDASKKKQEEDKNKNNSNEKQANDNSEVNTKVDENKDGELESKPLEVAETVNENFETNLLSTSSTNGDGKLGPVSDQDLISTKPREKVVIDWKDKLYLSPLTTVGNLPFRRICKEFGVDITCGEMAMASTILRGMPPEWALVKRHVSEDLFGVQLCGNNPYVMTKCAQLLEEQTKIDFIDVNLGCPIEAVYQRGEGSGLLRRDKVLGSVIQCMNNVLTIPLTVKTRTGVHTNKNIAHHLVPKFKAWGASLITVHGRSREQRYTKSADWPYIEQCAQLSNPVPLFLNGDVLSYEDYERARKECPSVAGAMIGRGALIKPWIFTEIKERRHWDISSQERLDILKKYANYGLEHWGSDTKGVENTRRFLLEWLSFLHRYIPYGILECPPQRINERPPQYQGRDELETLMASTNCADWIKISEMLLGPVPENYNFLPKHKANSWR